MRTQSTKGPVVRPNGAKEVEEFKRLMSECGFDTSASLAEHLGITRNTVANWMTGKTLPPHVTLLYLTLRRDVRRVGDAIPVVGTKKAKKRARHRADLDIRQA